jgi:nucleoid-associated protein YgaU
MEDRAMPASLTPRTAAAAALVTALAGGLVAMTARERPPLDPALGFQPATAPAPAPAEEPAAALPEAETTTEAPAEAESAATDPSFDIVRVAPGGAALVAGRAAPGATVAITSDDEVLAEVEASPAGEFVAIFRAPEATAPRALGLESTGPGGLRTARETVLLLPPAPAPGAPAAAATVDATEPATDTATNPAAEPATTETAAATDEPEPAVAVTAILRPDDAAVEVAPAEAPAPGPRRVSLASISYDDTGLVTLAGFGTAGARVRAYVDNAHATEGDVDGTGRWSLDLAGIDAGVYRLRVDEIDAEGRVASRVETPFQRDFPDLNADGTDPGSITVQPGNNLWTIARERYGRGILYTQIFTANAELIRDPSLIYPGQIFVLPVIEDAVAPAGIPGPLARP